MFKSLTVGKKIIAGFSLLLIIAIALGVIAVVLMSGVEHGAERLAKAYVPEVKVSNELERHTLLAMYANRGYALTENESYYQEGTNSLKAVTDALDQAESLAQEQQLEKLKEYAPRARQLAERYTELAKQTRAINMQLSDYRTVMDSSASVFTDNISRLIAVQERKMDEDLEDRMKKLDMTAHILSKANEARVSNFKAQATGNMTFMDQAIEQMAAVIAEAEALVPITTGTEDLARIDSIIQSARTYEAAMSGLMIEERKGAQSSASAIQSYRDQMNVAADRLMKATSSFFDAQTVKTKADIDERKSKIGWANDIIDMGNGARVSNFKAQATRDPAVLDEAVAFLDEMEPVFEQLYTVTRAPEDIAMLQATQDAAKRYRDAVVNFGNAWEQRQVLGDKRNEAGGAVLDIAQKTAAVAVGETTAISDDAHRDLSAASNTMTIGLILATVVGISLAWYLARSITGPLNTAIGTLSAGAEQTASASGQVSAASQSLAEGSSEQASSLEETSSSLEEMSSMTRRNAENATHANTISGETRQAAESGVREMEEMSRAMEAIKQSSDDISKIIKTIDEIAFQTNILALNAAVEAARAGEAGQGFAVVADEVRSLAQRSAVAARETAEKIEDAMSKSDLGVGISKRVSESLNEIVTRAREVDKLISEIASASNEQDQGIHQINQAISQMDQVTQSNAANAEETASASEELSAQAEELRAVVDDLITMVGANGIQQSPSRTQSHAPTAGRRYYLKADSAHKPTSSDKHKQKAALPKLEKEKPAPKASKSKASAADFDDDFKDF